MSAAKSEAERDELILEGIVITQDGAGVPNIAPMGPRINRSLGHFLLRPYTTAQTYRNLKVTGCGVLHVTDDVELLAKAAIGSLIPLPELASLPGFECPRLADVCRWFSFRVVSLDDSAERTTIECVVVAQGEVRPFFGFNRAKHAVLEAAILATRVGILPRDEILREFERLAIPIQKTAGHQERRAFDLLQTYIAQHLTPDS